jgi:DNA-binding transcriptional ArsR family regulator
MSSDKQKTTAKASPMREVGKFAYSGLERVIHERARLSILSSLSAHPQGLLFNDLKSLCDLTDGNLSRQLQALKEAEMVEVWKGVRRRRPQTMCRLTELGRRRFLEYIAELEKVVGNALGAEGIQQEKLKFSARLNVADA